MIAGLALAVITLTVIIPLPGTVYDNEDQGPVPAPDTTFGEEVVDLPIIPDSITVLVLNGTETDGFASRTQRNLLRASTDSLVILTPFDPSNTELKPFAETVIISHIPDLTAARLIAGILGRSENCIVWEVPEDGSIPTVDITVCLGQDMADPSPEEN